MKPTNQVLVDQLAAVEEQLAQRDARIAELERALEASRKTGEYKQRIAEGNASNFYEEAHLRREAEKSSDGLRRELEHERCKCESLRAELERARPVVESDEARKLRDLLQRCQFPWDKIRSWHYGAILVRALEAFTNSAPPASAPSAFYALHTAESPTAEYVRMETMLRAQLDERTRQVAQLQDDLTDARNARDKALAALKAAPVRCEREVDAELRAALSAWIGLTSVDEDLNEYVPEASTLLMVGRAWLAAPLAAPAQAEGERVTVYVLVGKDGSSDGQVCTEVTREQVKPYPGSYWLALDARRVREGGAS